jgi:hypothetical protein
LTPAGADGNANAELRDAAGRMRQKQVREIAAGYEQQQGGNALEEEKARAYRHGARRPNRLDDHPFAWGN